MINSKALRDEIRNSGYLLKFIAGKLSLTPYGLQKKIDGITEFKASEIVTLSDLLKFSDQRRADIFFGSKSDSKSH